MYQSNMYQNSHVPKTPYTSLTNCFAEYEHRTLCDAIVVTLAMLFRLQIIILLLLLLFMV